MDKQGLETPWVYRKWSDALMYAEGARYRILNRGRTFIAYHIGDDPGKEWTLTRVENGFIWRRSNG